MEIQDSIVQDCIQLLKDLIATPSYSKQEEDTATLLSRFFIKKEIEFERKYNNIMAYANGFDPEKPTIWLNSHHDTVRPNAGYTKDPFSPIIEDGKLFGLGSNDAGGPLVSLIACFLHFVGKEMPFNILLIASAEEEISGKNGIESLVPFLPAAELAIVGEPTLMKMAIAEKGLMVIDATVKGKSGHAAREEGINAIYLALDDLLKIKEFSFKRTSKFLGKSKVSATIIHSGTQHNVVPDTCEYTLDVRVTDAYTLEEALEELKENLNAELKPRSLRLQSSKVPQKHPILTVGIKLGMDTYGSPTLSDQALIPYPSIKIGPGDSARSHTADEFIYIKELEKGILNYILILEKYAELKISNLSN